LAGYSTPASGASLGTSLAGVVPEKLLDEGETVLLAIKPSLWFVAFRSAKVIGLALLMAVFSLYLARHYNLVDVAKTTMNLAGAAMMIRLLIAILEWTCRLYVLTDRRVIRIKGVFNIDVFECPLMRIQNTYMTLALHERIVRLGSIQFATAGSGAIEAIWHTINNPLEVHELVRRAIWRMRKRSEPSTNNL